MSTKYAPRFPTAPARAYAEHRAAARGMTFSEFLKSRLPQHLHRSIWRDTISGWTADAIACRLGSHPALLWPDFDKVDWPADRPVAA